MSKTPTEYFVEVMKQVKLFKDNEPQKIVCPKCQGKMIVNKNETNGHIYAICQSKNCISMMQ